MFQDTQPAPLATTGEPGRLATPSAWTHRAEQLLTLLRQLRDAARRWC
jgi:hypothetical protein